jgi:type II secretory pathway component GspD/PulD (secretin)
MIVHVTRSIYLISSLVLILLLTTAATADGLSRDQLERTPVSIAIDDAEAADVLKLLAAQNDLNLTVSSGVEGTVTLALKDVSVAAALDVIVAAVDAAWFIAGDVIVVRGEGETDLRELDIRLFPLRYIGAGEARKIIEPMLPEGSKLETLSRQGETQTSGWDETLQVATFPQIMERVAALIEQLDQPRPLVAIEVKIIETNLRDENKLGIDYPDALTLTLGGLEDEESGQMSLGSRDIEGGDWYWGKMTIAEVSVLLDLLIQNGRSKLISNPRVTTLSNQEAEIEVTTTIPVQTINRFSEGGIIQDIVSFQDLDVSIRLQVTPRVNPDSTIVLDVSSAVEEITGFTGPPDNQRPITARRAVNSSVTIKAGESLGLGGLMKEVEHKTVKKLPLLGSIPLLGRVFQHHTTSVEKTDLLILITPHIMGTS